MKRSELLKLSKDAVKSVTLPFKVRKEKKTLESWILEKEEKCAVLEDEIQTAKTKEELKVDSILDKLDDLELTQRRLKQGQELMKELYD